MTSDAPNRSLEFSQKLYQRMLAAYPRRHREEYGGAMTQLFRDQCRDAWDEGRTWGLVALWFRTLPDLVKTSFIERWSNFNPGKFMSDKLNAVLSPRNSSTFAFFAVFMVVFLIVFITAVAITFILPESYASTARIKAETDQADSGSTTGGQPVPMQSYDPYFIQTTFEIIQSQVVLSNVVATLNLNEKWGKKYYGGQTLKTTESMEILKRRIDLKTVRNTKLISITVYSEDKNEAAEIANALAGSYRDYRLQARRAEAFKPLETLQNEYKQQASQIDQLQSEKDTLVQKFGIMENWADLQKQYQSQLNDGKRTCQALKTQLDALEALAPGKLRDVLPTITGDAMLSDLVGKLRASEQEMSILTIDYAPSDVHVSRVAATMKELNGEIDERVAGIMTALKSEVASKQATTEALQTTIDSGLKNSKPIPENQLYWDKKHELDELLNYHDAICAKIDAMKLGMTFPPYATVEFVDYATPGDAPVKPNKPLNICIGAIAGIFLGAVAGSIAAFIAGRRGKLVAVRKPV